MIIIYDAEWKDTSVAYETLYRINVPPISGLCFKSICPKMAFIIRHFSFLGEMRLNMKSIDDAERQGVIGLTSLA